MRAWRGVLLEVVEAQVTGRGRDLEESVGRPVAELGDDREIELRDGEVLVSSHVPGSVWMVAVQEGDTIEPDTPLVIVESMKMEMAVASPKKLLIRKLFATAGMQVQPGTVLAIAEIVA